LPETRRQRRRARPRLDSAQAAVGFFIAAWSAYAFETAICYTSEFRDPGTDTYKAILYSGLLCIAVYTLVPLSFQGALGLAGVMAPGIVDGSGVAQAMAGMVGGGGAFVTNLLVVMLLLALMLAITTAMAGSSRTLYQGSVDGWLPRYLNHVNKNGAGGDPVATRNGLRRRRHLGLKDNSPFRSVC